MPSPFDVTLAAAVEFLRELPREKSGVRAARQQFASFTARHAEAAPMIIVDERPASLWVDYDILLEHPNGATVAVCWRDDSVPWAVHYAEHWAAPWVVSVGEYHLSVQHALMTLKLRGWEDPDLMDRLIENAVAFRVLQAAPIDSSDDQVQRASDDFRCAHGLLSAAAMHQWLEEMGLTPERWAEVLNGSMAIRLLKDQVTAGRIESWFEEHRADFDSVSYVRVVVPEAEDAERLATSARRLGLIAALQQDLMGSASASVGTIRREYAHRLPSTLAAAAAGTIVGPMTEPTPWVAEVLARQPAELNERTRVAVRDALFDHWVAEERARHGVRWHWM